MRELRNARKLYAAGQGIDGVSLTFPAGQCTALIGPSGCGKSTLLRMLVGLITPDRGEVWADGQRVQPGDWPRLRHATGYVVQGGGLFPHLSVRDNAALVARHLGKAADWIDGRLRELCPLVRFDPAMLARYPRQMSGGQQQRAALLRALVLDPPTLLLDEPLGALDPLVRADLQKDLQTAIRGTGKTAVIVTHDLAEAGFLGDRLVLLQAGRIVQEGTLADLARRPADPFVKRFFEAQRPLPELMEAAP